jgi:hypothetical protein
MWFELSGRYIFQEVEFGQKHRDWAVELGLPYSGDQEDRRLRGRLDIDPQCCSISVCLNTYCREVPDALIRVVRSKFHIPRDLKMYVETSELWCSLEDGYSDAFKRIR